MSKKYEKPTPEISVLIPVYGSIKDVLPQTLESVVNSIDNLSFEIILVDDKSPNLDDETKKFYSELKQKYPISVIYYHKENKGFGKTVNDAASFAKGKYYLIWSTDVMMMPKSVNILHEQLVNNNDIGITFPKLLFPKNSPNGPAGMVQHCGIVFDFEKTPFHNFIGWNPEHPFVNRVRDYNACTGAIFLIKREVWQKVGGFDTVYGTGTAEDICLSLRVRIAGFKIRFLPQVVGTHFVAMSSLRENNPFPIDRNISILKQRYEGIIPFDAWLYSGL